MNWHAAANWLMRFWFAVLIIESVFIVSMLLFLTAAILLVAIYSPDKFPPTGYLILGMLGSTAPLFQWPLYFAFKKTLIEGGWIKQTHTR